MANLRIAPINFHDDSTVTSANENTALPATNTQTVTRGLVYRSTNATTPFDAIKGTFAVARRVNCFALFRHNLYGANVQLRLYSDAAWTTQVYDSTALASATLIVGAYDWGYTPGGTNTQFDPLISEVAFSHFFTEQTIRSYKVTVSGTLGAAYAEIGRAFLGRYLEMTYNPAPGLGLGWDTNDSQVRTLGGSLPSSARARWRTLNADLSWVAEAQRPTLLDMMAQCGLNRDLLVSVHPGAANRQERDYMMNAKFTDTSAITRNNAFATKKLTLKEV
jgi:hypothetical protein